MAREARPRAARLYRRTVDEADREVAALLQHPFVADVEGLRGFASATGKRVHHDRHVPREGGVYVPSEKLRQLFGYLLGVSGARISPSVTTPEFSVRPSLVSFLLAACGLTLLERSNKL